MLGLPEEFTALNGTQEMSDTGIDPDRQEGRSLHGTFGPGRHDARLPLAAPVRGEKTWSLRRERFRRTWPRCASWRAASQKMRLVASGFPERRAAGPTRKGSASSSPSGRCGSDDPPPLTSVHVELRDLPTRGPRAHGSRPSWRGSACSSASRPRLRRSARDRQGAQTRATSRKPRRRERRKEKAARARAPQASSRILNAAPTPRGDVGPKTYERARRDLIDAIARTLASTRAPSTSPHAEQRDPPSAPTLREIARPTLRQTWSGMNRGPERAAPP